MTVFLNQLYILHGNDKLHPHARCGNMLEDMTGSHWKQYNDLAFVSLTSELKSLCKQLYLPVSDLFSNKNHYLIICTTDFYTESFLEVHKTQDTENLMCKNDDQ